MFKNVVKALRNLHGLIYSNNGSKLFLSILLQREYEIGASSHLLKRVSSSLYHSSHIAKIQLKCQFLRGHFMATVLGMLHTNLVSCQRTVASIQICSY